MKGFWIPIELMDLDISWTKRILLAEIGKLEMLDAGCVATNVHFAEQLKISRQAVSNALNSLENDGLIVLDNSKTVRNFGRKITIHENTVTIHESSLGEHKNVESKDNNTFNKTINTIEREEFVKVWNENAEVVGITKLRLLNDARYKKLQQRIKANENFLDDVVECLGKVSGSKFLQDGSWFGFDWLVANDTNYVKVLEGSYDNK